MAKRARAKAVYEQVAQQIGKYDIDQFVKEQAGWHAICDKLLLI